MIVAANSDELKVALNSLSSNGSNTGFVPTMGALHKGHLQLINRARKENNVVVCSVFVNPTQFNDKNDLDNYPRTIENDITLLEKAGCDVVFLPQVNDMYPDGVKVLNINLNGLETNMEGAYRPGHFQGMITIVDKLLKTVNARNNYFGEKDFQQLAIIKHYVKQFSLPFNIIGCDTVREEDGLAYSSRNVLLTPEERVAAPVIYKILMQCSDLKKSKNVEALKAWVKEQIDNTMILKVQYISFVDAESLKELNAWTDSENCRACIAVLTSGTRLIDNVAV